ncbi:MAG: glucosaminidase domain-containing protein [Bacteroidota bacterium]
MANVDQTRPLVGSGLGRIITWVRRHAFEIFIILLILHICLSRGLSFKVNVHDPQSGLSSQWIDLVGGDEASQAGVVPVFKWVADLFRPGKVTQLDGSLFGGHSDGLLSTTQAGDRADRAHANSAFTRHVGQTNTPAAQNVSLLSVTGSFGPGTKAIDSPAAAQNGLDHFNSVSATNDPAPHINNLTIVLSPSYFRRHNIPAHVAQSKRNRLQDYLDTYAPLAQAEMRKYAIPASITLAQGLLESNAGDSRLATQSNNHFGIKCKSKCLGCTCRNYGDDTRYDMFRVFKSVAESFEEHSALLQNSRYKRLYTYGNDYTKWAHGLKACGYATDPNYGKKLVKIIERLELNKYDVN